MSREYDEYTCELVPESDPRVRNARAREYLRRRRRERVQRAALTFAPVAAFALMFLRA